MKTKPIGWTACKLRDVLKIKHGFAFAGEYFGASGPYALVTPGNFFESGGFKNNGAKQKRYDGPVPRDYVLAPGALIVAMTEQAEGLLGSAALVPNDDVYLHNQRIGLVASDVAHCHFIYYLMNSESVRLQIRATCSGTKVRHTSPSRIGEAAVNLPPILDQHRIADVLSAYDDLIEVNQRRIAILEEMARRLFEEWFVRFRYPGHEAVPLVETELGLAPEGWRVLPLDSLCSRITDGSHWSPKSQQAGLPMASVKDMRDRGFDLGQVRYISQEDYQDLVRNGCKPNAGDILIAKDGANLNKHTFLVCEDLEIVVLSSIAILRPSVAAHGEFLTALLRSDEVSARIKRSVSGAAIPRIILKDFKKLKLLIPPEKLILDWASRCGPLVQQCRLMDAQNTRLRAARDLLLPKLISGEIDVSRAERRFAEAAE